MEIYYSIDCKYKMLFHFLYLLYGSFVIFISHISILKDNHVRRLCKIKKKHILYSCLNIYEFIYNIQNKDI